MEVLTHILAFLAGLGTSYALKIVINSRKSGKNSNNSVHQSGNSAGGDIIGGNKISGKE